MVVLNSPVELVVGDVVATGSSVVVPIKSL